MLFSMSAALVAALVPTLAMPTISALSPQDRARVLDSRDGTQAAVQGLPACNTTEGDPTNAVGKSRWTDGQGNFMGSDCDNKETGNDHCWTDYYVIGTDQSYNQWQEAVGNIECPEHGSCSEAVAELNQSCTAFTLSVAEGIKIQWDWLFMKVEGNLQVTEGRTWQTCQTKSATETCTWTSGCHSVWSAQAITNVYGYMRRSCASSMSGNTVNMPNSAKRADGFYTRGMLDFTIPLAGQNEIYCDGTCDQGFNPGPLPKGNSTITRYIAPVTTKVAAATVTATNNKPGNSNTGNKPASSSNGNKNGDGSYGNYGNGNYGNYGGY